MTFYNAGYLKVKVCQLSALLSRQLGRKICQLDPMHNWEPSVVTWNYENIRSLRVFIWSQDFPLSHLVQPLQRLKYITDFVQMHLTFEGIGPKM